MHEVIRIVSLEAMQVASFYSFGASPELIAWQKLVDWVKTHDLKNEKLRIFGFNNPSPSEGSPNYGYEFWLSVDNEQAYGDDTTVKGFEGGLYAVTEGRGVQNIGGLWQTLSNWCEGSNYSIGTHQWLEEHLGPFDPEIDIEALHLDLYLPIRA